MIEAGMYLEDFVVGDVLRHPRGKTVGDLEGVLFAHLSMNTAEGHFNEHFMSQRPHGRLVVFGGVTCSIVIGLASQDVAAHAVRELGLEQARFLSPVFHGDTLYAFTEVLDVEIGDGEGEVRLRHVGRNQDDKTVFQAVRRLVVRGRSKG